MDNKAKAVGKHINEQTLNEIKKHDRKGVFGQNQKERERNIKTQSKLTEDTTQMSQLIDRWSTKSFQG